MVDVTWMREPNGYIRISSFILSCISLAIFLYHPILEYKHESRLAVISTATNFTVLFYLILSYLCDNQEPGINPKTEMGFFFINGILTLTVGGICTSNHQYEKHGNHFLIFGLFMVSVGCLFLVDVSICYKNYRKDDDSSHE